jgi:ketosteroid isomerase-like protein
MSEDDFEVIRQAWAAFSRGDVAGFLQHLGPDIEVVPFGAKMEGKLYRGQKGVRQWWEREIDANWQVFETRPEVFRRVGERILVFGHWVARGKTSGVDLDVPATWIVDVCDGKIVHWQTYTDRAEALEALGLPEQDAHADS